MHTYKDSCLKFCLNKIKEDFSKLDFYGFALALPLIFIATILALPISVIIDFCIAIYKAI